MASNDDQDLVSVYNDAIRLPLPTPLPEAVEAGVFGRCVAGGLAPDRDDVRSIVEQHLYLLVQLTQDIGRYVRAEKLGCHPKTCGLSRSAVCQAANRKLAAEFAKNARVQRMAHLNSYEEAFGNEARIRYQEFAMRLASAEPRLAMPEVQRELF